ncbi:flagellar hook-associated protein FlgK [Muricoccus pecuniae]|uniref:Flagellar hook-associated protein 1 n=1 Tax=Muricoccus pecuniae TaxID=693023 RepID=A0A840Y8Q4_9PROT|nr:flagellar basal body rod C-terminal domain-containing protein [Roseomonas pecuniae]MBB5692757.1 flagellar hook-associated protein 1 FlgK [Roseomonas pecuniae]
MSLDLALSIARSGLSHVNRQLAQTASNISNAGTAGYTRKEVQGQSVVAGAVLSGVRSAESARAVDTALVTEMNLARARSAASTARAGILEGVETAHGATGDSIGDLTAALGDAFVSLRDDPSDPLLQARIVDAADDLAERYNTVSTAIGTARQAAQDGMVKDVETLNDALRRISDLTDQILPLRARGASTADLEDQRDQAVVTIASIMQVRALPQPDGGITLITSGGLNLPLRSAEGPFSTDPMLVGPQAYYGTGGTLPGIRLGNTDVTARLGEGTLAAYVSLRDRELPLAQAELDISAASLASRFDRQGLRLFTGAAEEVPDPSSDYKTGNWIGFAGSLRVNTDVEKSPRLVRDGTHSVASGAGGATAFTPNGATGPADFTTLLDRVLNQTFGTEVTAGTSHPSFATLSLGPAGNLSSSLRSARSLGDYASQLVATQTAVRAEAEEAGKMSGDLLAALESRFSAQSGVDMDKELAAMISLQTTYSANARLLSAVQGMYDTLFQAVR